MCVNAMKKIKIPLWVTFGRKEYKKKRSQLSS